MTVTLTGFILKEVLLLQEKQIENNKLKVENEEVYSFFVNSFISDEEN